MEKIQELRDTIVRWMKRTELAETEIEAWREREAACCPEDVGFDEYITALRKEVERLTRINTWLKDPEGCHAANPGETGYHCDANAPCTPCRLRHAEAKLEEVSDLVNLAISGITPPSTLMDKALESLNQAADLLAQPTKQLEPITSIADAKLKKVRARVTDSLRRHGLVTQKEDQ